MKLMKKICCLFLILGLVTGCSNKVEKYSTQFIGPFDTAFQVIMYEDSEKDFNEYVSFIKERFEYYNDLFDRYNTYENVNNIKTINDNAGIAPVKVDDALFNLIEFSLEDAKKYSDKVNIALGPVLEVWHNYRELNDGSVPTLEELQEKYILCDASKVQLDKENKTVYLMEKGMSLDVGATAKGYAAQLVKQELIEKGIDNFLISAGGNLVSHGKRGFKADKSALSDDLPACLDYYTIDITSPNNGAYEDINRIAAVIMKDGAVVTSGDYQRYFVGNDGKTYHHLIDPSTLFPATYFRSVTIFTSDSGLADFLSSATFLVDYQTGKQMIESLEGVEAIWLHNDGTISHTSGLIEGENCHFYAEVVE